MEGELIQSQLKGIDTYVPIFLTFPTGWRYHKQYRQFRRASLDAINTAICIMSNVPESKNTLPSLRSAAEPHVENITKKLNSLQSCDCDSEGKHIGVLKT